MAGYIRQSSFVDGDTITAALFNNEFNQMLSAFSNTGGHKHDGTTAEGPVIGLIGDAGETAPNNKVLIDTTNNFIEFYVQVSSNPVQQLYIADGAIIPVTDSDVDLGTTALRFKDAYIDSITTTGNVGVGGNLTVTGTTTFNGGTITMGDAATDNVVFGADVNSNIIPNTDSAFDLGSASQEWRDLYLDGTAHIDTLDVDVNATVAGTLGVTGVLTGSSLDISGDIDVDGTTNLDVVDIDGAVDMATTLAVAGNVDFNGDLDVDGTTNLDVVDIDGAVDMASNLAVGGNITVTGDLTVNGSTTTLNTATLDVEDKNITLNKGAGDTSGSVDGAGITIQDAVDASNDASITWSASNDNFVFSHEVVAPSLDISGNVDIDGTLETDALSINSTAVTASAADINLIDGITNGTVIASKAIITDANIDITGGRNITISGELDAATLDISGDADIDGTLEADAITIAGVTLAETISDTVGAMVGSNTETGISVTYDDSDNTLDFVIGADSIVSSMLDTNIDIAGTLDVTGVLTADTNATIAGTLGIAGGSTNGVAISQGAISIKNGGAKSYIDLYCESSNAHYTRIEAAAHGAYSGNVTATLPVTTGTLAITSEIPTTEEIQDIVGAMVSSNTESGITVAYQDADGTIDFTVGTLNQNTTGSAATLTTARTIHGVSFNGSANIDLSEVISDTVGAMFSSNTETNITATYQDADNTIDLVVDAAQPNVTSLGTLTTLRVDDVVINGTTIGHADDTDLMTVADGVLTVAGEVDAVSLDISGDVDVDGTLETDNLTIGGAQGSDGQVLTSTGSGVGWEDAGGGSSGATFKEAGTNFANSLMVGDDATGTLSSATGNTALGIDVFKALTSGTDNVAVGFNALPALTSGTLNTGIGKDALQAVTTALYSTALGANAGSAITTGNGNTAIGANTMTSGTTAANNTVVGTHAATSLTDGIGNTILGTVSGIALTTGDYNNTLGYAAGYAITTGDENICIGNSAALALTTGSDNIAIGSNALNSATTTTGQIAIGFEALKAQNANGNNTAVGYQAGLAVTSGASNVLIGEHAGKSITTGYTNVCVGSNCFDMSGNITGYYNTVVGTGNSRRFSTGLNHTSMGTYASAYTTTASSNTSFGSYAAHKTTTGASNTAIGGESLYNNTTGTHNTCVGIVAGNAITTGDKNLCLGYDAGTSGSPNHITTGDNAIVLGNNATASAHIRVDWTVTSDKRDKTDIEPLTMGLDFVNKLEPVTYRWDMRSDYSKDFSITPDGTHKQQKLLGGLLAQDVEKLEREYGYKVEDETAVLTDKHKTNGNYGLTYSKFIPVLINAVQELSTQVDELKSELLALKGE